MTQRMVFAIDSTRQFELTSDELEDLRSKFSSAKFAKTRSLPKAFTEKGLYIPCALCATV